MPGIETAFESVVLYINTYIHTFTFMHLADAFIQSDLHCIQVTVCTYKHTYIKRSHEKYP